MTLKITNEIYVMLHEKTQHSLAYVIIKVQRIESTKNRHCEEAISNKRCYSPPTPIMTGIYLGRLSRIG